MATPPTSSKTASPGPSNAVLASAGDGKQLIRQLVKHCYLYKGANNKSGLIQFTISAGAYFSLCSVMLYSFIHEGYVFASLLILPASGFLVRLFVIQHDCGHSSFFHSP